MVGITFEFSHASQDKPNEGRIEATVDGYDTKFISVVVVVVVKYIFLHPKSLE